MSSNDDPSELVEEDRFASSRSQRRNPNLVPISKGRWTCRNCGHQTNEPGLHCGIGSLLCPEIDQWIDGGAK